MMEPLFTKKEAAAYLKVSERTVDREIARLGLKRYTIGRSVRIPEATITLLIQDHRMTRTDAVPRTVKSGEKPTN